MSITLEQMLEQSVLEDSTANVVSDQPLVPNQVSGLRLVQTPRESRRLGAIADVRTASPCVDAVEGRFESDVGTIEYMLYPPCKRTGGEMSLVVMLHGAGQDAADFAAGTRMHAHAAAEDTWVLYPGQRRDVPLRCWSWFGEDGQTRGEGEPALLAALTRWIIAEHDISPRRVYAAGLSAGAAMAVVLGQTYPDVYAAIGSHSGIPYAAASDVFAAFDVMARGPTGTRRSRPGVARIPTIVFHGDADRTVHPDNANALVAGAVKGGPTAQRPLSTRRAANAGIRAHTTTTYRDSRDRECAQQWVVHDAGHAWSGGSADGSYTDPSGPDATGAMLRFFRSHRLEPRVMQ